MNPARMSPIYLSGNSSRLKDSIDSLCPNMLLSKEKSYVDY